MAGCQEPGDLEDLRDTVKSYGRHVLVCAGWTTWPERVEHKEDLLGQITSEVKELKDRVDPPPKATALRTEPAGEGVDLIVFPDALVYRGIQAEGWERIRERHLVDGDTVEDLDPEPVDGHHVLVCNHGARDQRCGACGPLVAQTMEEAIEERDLSDVTVHRSSHVGGHRFAGNVLVYPGGRWYGYIRPELVDDLLDAIEDGRPLEAHYRGAMVTAADR